MIWYFIWQWFSAGNTWRSKFTITNYIRKGIQKAIAWFYVRSAHSEGVEWSTENVNGFWNIPLAAHKWLCVCLCVCVVMEGASENLSWFKKFMLCHFSMPFLESCVPPPLCHSCKRIKSPTVALTGKNTEGKHTTESKLCKSFIKWIFPIT